MKSIAYAALLSLFTLQSATAHESAPKWCKSSNLNAVETMICGDKALSGADMLMSHIYQQVMAFRGEEGHEGHWPGEVISNQQDWISARNKAKSQAQILDAYMTRNQELYRILLDRRSTKY